MVLLSILICTIPQRIEFLRRLCHILYDQLYNSPNRDIVEVLIAEDNCIMSVGEKRNKLIAAAVGKYVCFIDDDDMVPCYYVDRIVESLRSSSGSSIFDCLGFRYIFRFKGVDNPAIGTASLSCTEWHTNRDKMTRSICHLNPILRSIASSVKFDAVNRGEDHKWSIEVCKKLKNECFLDEVMYIYEAYPELSTSNQITSDTYKGIAFTEFNFEELSSINCSYI